VIKIERVIIKTTSNVTYAGNLTNSFKFSLPGIAIRPNKLLKMEVFVPKEEIAEIIYGGRRFCCDEFLLMDAAAK